MPLEDTKHGGPTIGIIMIIESHGDTMILAALGCNASKTTTSRLAVALLQAIGPNRLNKNMISCFKCSNNDQWPIASGQDDPPDPGDTVKASLGAVQSHPAHPAASAAGAAAWDASSCSSRSSSPSPGPAARRGLPARPFPATNASYHPCLGESPSEAGLASTSAGLASSRLPLGGSSSSSLSSMSINTAATGWLEGGSNGSSPRLHAWPGNTPAAAANGGYWPATAAAIVDRPGSPAGGSSDDGDGAGAAGITSSSSSKTSWLRRLWSGKHRSGGGSDTASTGDAPFSSPINSKHGMARRCASEPCVSSSLHQSAPRMTAPGCNPSILGAAASTGGIIDHQHVATVMTAAGAASAATTVGSPTGSCTLSDLQLAAGMGEASHPTSPAAGVAAAAAAALGSARAAARVARAASVATLHPAVKAHLDGTLGIAFSGGGFR